MGFDKPGESRFVIPVSDTQAYKQFGNAVAVPCVEALAHHIAHWLCIEEAGDRALPPMRLPLFG